MWQQMYGVCYCLSNCYAIIFRHNRRFNDHAATQFRDRQKPHPLISRRAVLKRNYRPRMKSQKTARSVNMLNHVTTISVLSATSALQSQKMSPRWSLAQWSAVAWTKHILFIGASTSVLNKLEGIQNTLARVVTRQHGWSSISAILHNRHWLPIKWRIDFKVATLTSKVLQSGKPSYLSSRIAIVIPRRLLRSSSVNIKNVLFQRGLAITLSSILHCASDLTTADSLSGRRLSITNLHNK